MSKLKVLRHAMGLPIAAVAVRARVGTGTIVMIERHGHEPRIETKQKIAAALGVETTAIWPGTSQSDQPTVGRMNGNEANR